METKFTPGPWIYEPETLRKGYAGVSGTSRKRNPWIYFAEVVVETDGENNGEGVANARLISAAPELYEALEEILAADDAGDTWGGAALKARAILAKARGE